MDDELRNKRLYQKTRNIDLTGYPSTTKMSAVITLSVGKNDKIHSNHSIALHCMERGQV